MNRREISSRADLGNAQEIVIPSEKHKRQMRSQLRACRRVNGVGIGGLPSFSPYGPIRRGCGKQSNGVLYLHLHNH